MKLHSTKYMTSTNSREINLLTRADDGSFVLKYRIDLMQGSRIKKEAMPKWGIITRVGASEKIHN